MAAKVIGRQSEFVSRFAIAALGASGATPLYDEMLLSSLAAAPPPYGEGVFGDQYRSLARKPSFFASLLVSDVHMEGYSADQLWRYAHIVPDIGFAKGLRRHAQDEARHSRMFASLLFTLFPKLKLQDGLPDKLASMSPRLRATGASSTALPRTAPFEEVLNTAILINLHEVKALVLEALLRPLAAAYAEPARQQRVSLLVARLMQDEVEHIRYTAEFIETAARAGYEAHISEAMVGFQVLLNESTREELERTSMLATSMDDVAERGAAYVQADQRGL